MAVDESAPVERRAAAIRTLGRDAKSRNADLALLGSFLSPTSDAGLQSAAIAAPGSIAKADTAQVFLKNWKRTRLCFAGRCLMLY